MTTDPIKYSPSRPSEAMSHHKYLPKTKRFSKSAATKEYLGTLFVKVKVKASYLAHRSTQRAHRRAMEKMMGYGKSL